MASPVVAPSTLMTPAGKPARVALVHEWFDTYYGSERVAAEILKCFPDADVFTLVDIMAADQRRFLDRHRVQTSFIQRLPFAKPHFRRYLPLLPIAIEQFDLGAYDLVLSSSHAFAKGVLTGPRQLHVSYVHAPMRYAWEYQHQYLRESGLERGLGGLFARYVLHRMRIWDYRTANGVDRFLANSGYIASRIHKIYRRESAVVYPPVETARFELQTAKDNHYLAVSRFVPYKHTETVVEAFRALPERKLVVIGDGPGLAKTRAACPANVTLLGFQPFAELHRHLRSAKALVFAAEEDFGITPVEAQACGTPVIAFGRGGALETVRGLDASAPTGLFFDEQTPAAIAAAVERFERDGQSIAPDDCRRHALQFAPERFHEAFLAEVRGAWDRHNAGARGPSAGVPPPT